MGFAAESAPIDQPELCVTAVIGIRVCSAHKVVIGRNHAGGNHIQRIAALGVRFSKRDFFIVAKDFAIDLLNPLTRAAGDLFDKGQLESAHGIRFGVKGDIVSDREVFLAAAQLKRA